MIDANTALNQLAQANNGINRLVAMIGAKNFAKDENSVSFRFPSKARNKANYFKLILKVDDTYSAEFGYIRSMNYTVRSEVEGLYFDQLKEYFENETGLYLSL